MLPRGLADEIDAILKEVKDPLLNSRNALARRAGERIIKRANLEGRRIARKRRGRVSRVAVNPSKEQRTLIDSAVTDQIIPFISADEAYRYEIREMLKELARKVRRRQRVE